MNLFNYKLKCFIFMFSLTFSTASFSQTASYSQANSYFQTNSSSQANSNINSLKVKIKILTKSNIRKSNVQNFIQGNFLTKENTISQTLNIDIDSLELRGGTPLFYPALSINEFKLLVEMKNTENDIIFTEMIDNPSKVRFEGFNSRGEAEYNKIVQLEESQFEIRIPRHPQIDSIDIFELSLNQGKIEKTLLGQYSSKELFFEAEQNSFNKKNNSQIDALALQKAAVNPFQIEKYFENGNPNDKINFILLGDGFTADQQKKFISYAKKSIDYLFSEEPFKKNKAKFNVYFVKAISSQNCIKQFPTDTCQSALQSYFKDSSGRFLIANTEVVNKVINDLFPNLDPSKTFKGVIANTTRRGGTGGAVFITALSDDMAEVYAHETGHSFGLLADEYSYYYNDDRDIDFQRNRCVLGSGSIGYWGKNITDNSSYYSWKDQHKAGLANVGLYQGGDYCEQNRWRGCFESKMQYVNKPWCLVNERLLLKRINSLAP